MDPNPYADFLGDRDAVEVLSATSARLRDLAARLPAEQLAVRPPEGKWYAREIVAHLADCDLVFGYRLRQTLAEPDHVIQVFDQDHWAERYGAFDFKSALALFLALRHANLLLIESATAEDRKRPVTHPERGAMTFWTIVETMAGHDLNHLQQLERIATSAAP
ncbi:MAG TPA: DinB family protein [Acidobacteriaceae bacterium]